MKYKYFSYCPEDGFDTHETLEDALLNANGIIPNYLDEGWSEDVTGVFVGTITHAATMCDKVERAGEVDEHGYDEDGEHWPDPDWEYKCNYKMLPVEADLNSKLALLAKLLWRARSSVDYQMGSQNQNTDAGKAHIEGFKGLLVEIDSAISEYRTQGGDV